MLAKGLFAGATSYEEQSIEELTEDIVSWLQFTEETKKHLEKVIFTLEKERNCNNPPI